MHNISMAGLALRFLLTNENVQKIVIGPRTVEQLNPVKEAISLKISPEEADKIWKMFK